MMSVKDRRNFAQLRLFTYEYFAFSTVFYTDLMIKIWNAIFALGKRFKIKIIEISRHCDFSSRMRNETSLWDNDFQIVLINWSRLCAAYITVFVWSQYDDVVTRNIFQTYSFFVSIQKYLYLKFWFFDCFFILLIKIHNYRLLTQITDTTFKYTNQIVCRLFYFFSFHTFLHIREWREKNQYHFTKIFLSNTEIARTFPNHFTLESIFA